MSNKKNRNRTAPSLEDLEMEATKKKLREELLLQNHERLTPEHLKQIAEFCTNIANDYMRHLIAIQETTKKAALTFTQLAEYLQTEAKVMEKEDRDTKVENVFDNEDDIDPLGPTVNR